MRNAFMKVTRPKFHMIVFFSQNNVKKAHHHDMYMDPWQDRHHKTTSQVDTEIVHICPNYPTCPKQERKYLNEVRTLDKNVSTKFKLSNGMRATDFCLQYIMKNHFQRKSNPQKSKI